MRIRAELIGARGFEIYYFLPDDSSSIEKYCRMVCDCV